MNPFRRYLALILLILLVSGCETEQKKTAAIIGISSDPESLNPLYAFSGYEINISELLYPSLVQMDWNEQEGILAPSPLLAEKIVWSADSSFVIVTLRKDLKWSDGKKVTVDDVIYSFDLFSDPAVQSRLYGTFKNFETDTLLKILPKSFEKIDDLKLSVFFRKGSAPDLIDLDLPILPRHVYEKVSRTELPVKAKDLSLVTCGGFTLASWSKNQSIILKKNPNFYLIRKVTPDEFIFRVIPDYNSRLTQLKNGEIDLAEDIRTDDVKELEEYEDVLISFIKAREYDYIGWNNIDPVLLKSKNQVKANPLFGSSEIRKALTMSVNRFEIMKEYLKNYGEVASTPVSPIFKSAADTLKPLEFNPAAASEILKKEGWSDKDNDGILEKGNLEFTFTLNIPSGNPRRDFAAVVIRNNLKTVGIDARIEPLEPSVFFEEMFNKQLNAWMAGWSIPIPPEFRVYWYSDPAQAQFNVVSFSNKSADSLLNTMESEKSPVKKGDLYRRLGRIIYLQNPVTMLYWIDNIVAHNSRIKNVLITPLGAIHHMWEWETDE